jgi:gas vesicle protein
MKDYRLGDLVRAGSWGAILGAAAGFALGILLAPEEGRKVRRRLVYQLEHLSEQLGSFVDGIVSPSSHSSEARKEGAELVADARERAERIQQDIDALLSEVKQGESSASKN